MLKTALVVGANGGIGSAVSKALLGRGISVYASVFRNRENIEGIQGAFQNCQVIKCDIRNEGEVQNLVDTVLQSASHINLVVNCVTPALQLKPFDQLTSEAFREEMDVILFGGIALFQALLPQMKKQRSGVMINLLTATVAGMPPARMSSYVVAKYALLGLTKSLAAEWDRFNIKIFGLSPAFVETELIKVFPEKLLEIEREKQADQKLLQPGDVAEAVWHLFEGADQHRTGENIVIQNRRAVGALKVPSPHAPSA